MVEIMLSNLIDFDQGTPCFDWIPDSLVQKYD